MTDGTRDTPGHPSREGVAGRVGMSGPRWAVTADGGTVWTGTRFADAARVFGSTVNGRLWHNGRPLLNGDGEQLLLFGSTVNGDA